MISRITTRKWLFVFASTLIAACLISSGVFSAKRSRAQQGNQQPRVNHMPPIMSKVKDLEVIGASIINPNTAHAGVELEIKNHSNKDAVAIDVVCGEGGVTRNGLHDEEHPIVVLKARGTTTIRMGFGEMTFGAPLVVSAVTWADGLEEGDEKSLRAMHIARKRHRELLKAEKQREARKGAPTP